MKASELIEILTRIMDESAADPELHMQHGVMLRSGPNQGQRVSVFWCDEKAAVGFPDSFPVGFEGN